MSQEKQGAEPEETQDTRGLGERIEDGLDDLLIRVQDGIYGARGSIETDVPATMEDADGFRHVIGHATRRNLAKRLIVAHPRLWLILLGIAVAGAILSLLLQ